MSATSERYTQPIAVLASAGVVRVTVIAGPVSVGENYVLTSGELSFGGSAADVDLGFGDKVGKIVLKSEDGRFTLRRSEGDLEVLCRREGSAPIAREQRFRVGTERLRVVENQDHVSQKDEEGTVFFASPLRKGGFSVQQLLPSGHIGAAASAIENVVVIGADGAGLVLSHEPSVSNIHAQIVEEDGALTIHDSDSLNGIYTPLEGEEELTDGSLFWVGPLLLRVDVTQ